MYLPLLLMAACQRRFFLFQHTPLQHTHGSSASKATQHHERLPRVARPFLLPLLLLLIPLLAMMAGPAAPEARGEGLVGDVGSLPVHAAVLLTVLLVGRRRAHHVDQRGVEILGSLARALQVLQRRQRHLRTGGAPRRAKRRRNARARLALRDLLLERWQPRGTERGGVTAAHLVRRHTAQHASSRLLQRRLDGLELLRRGGDGRLVEVLQRGGIHRVGALPRGARGVHASVAALCLGVRWLVHALSERCCAASSPLCARVSSPCVARRRWRMLAEGASTRAGEQRGVRAAGPRALLGPRRGPVCSSDLAESEVTRQLCGLLAGQGPHTRQGRE